MLRLVVFCTAVTLFGCNEAADSQQALPGEVLPIGAEDDVYNSLIEVSAGSHFTHSISVEDDRFHLSPDTAPQTRFLPFPTNAGFIPSFSADSTLNRIPVWLFSTAVEPGAIVPSRPLALLDYVDRGSAIRSVVMVPIDDSLDIYKIPNFESLSLHHDGLKYAFEYWLRNKSGIGSISRIRWGDEIEAERHLVEQLNN